MWRAGLLEIAPRGLCHVFYSDSGSTAVEVALKMALGFWHNQGKPRTRIIALEHAYHGDTVGTMSAGARGVFNAAYEPLLFDVVRLPFPAPGREQETLDLLKAAAPDAAALMVEPLILGAGGMLIYPPEVLRALAIICRRNGALLIADEVMTGFGRTGTLFACEAGRHFARHSLPGQGPHRRQPAAGGDPVHAGDIRRALFHRPQPHLLSFQFLHRQSHRLRRRPRQSEKSGATSRCWSAWRRWARCRRSGWPGSARCTLRECPPPGHHRGAGPEGARSRLSGGDRAGTRPLLPGARRLAAPAGQHHLCHAALLHHGGGTRSGI